MNDKVTDAFITDMVVGQRDLGNSLNQSKLVPQTYTLQFSFVDVQLDVSGQPFIPTAQAIISWKVQGQQQRRVISIVSGASISGVCNAVDVKIRDIPNGGDNTRGKKYKVQTTLSRGVRANTQEPPTLTDTLLQAINNNTTDVWDVPKDSGVTSLFILIAAGSAAAVFDDKAIIASMSDITVPSPSLLGGFYPLKCCHWIPLAPGSQRVSIFNFSGVQVFAQVIWGIDG